MLGDDLTAAAEPAPVRRTGIAWHRPALAVLLLGTAALYLWNLGASGYANDFYAAAVQAGTQDWKALLFGALDPANFITVDKPPAALWVMGISGRIFGFSSWSMLAPQALEGVASVFLLYAAVKRWSGPLAGLLAGAILALTPVAVLMFKFNNPDALLVLLMVAAGYCVVRAIDALSVKASTLWIALAGAAIGFGFLTKMLQVLLVVPAMALVFLVAAQGGWWRRIWQLLVAGGAIVVSAGWWLLAVALVPASQRPYIGGSTDNSPLELAFGYNGLQRIFGGERRGGGGMPAPPANFARELERAGFTSGGGPGGGGFGGQSGITRMFGENFGTQISWLLPAALVGLLVVLWLTRKAARTDRVRAGLILWGGWMVVTGLVFSFMSGIIHEYYSIALAPGIAATVAIAVTYLWQRRAEWVGRITLAVIAVVTSVWSYVLLNRTDWLPVLSYIAAAAGILTAIALLVGMKRWRHTATVAIVAAVLTAFTGTASYAVETAVTSHDGSTPSAGPGGNTRGAGRLVIATPQGTFTGPANGGAPNRNAGGRPGGTTNAALVKLLQATNTRWAAATTGSQEAAPLELASKKAVMAMGGFSGGDPAPTLAQFQQYVAQGQVRYYLPGGRVGGGPPMPSGQQGQNRLGGGRGDSGEISTWVAAHFTAITVGGETIYDLSQQIK
nr:glycosyltransferase family 39 protein [Fodinicola acaciae]